MTRKREGPPDGTRRTLKSRTSSIRKLNNTDEDNSPNSQFQGPRAGDVAEIVSGLIFQRHVERVHQLGPRAVAELLAEVGAERAIQHLIDRKVAQYASIDPGALAATGGDGFWPTPLHEVRR